jgi:hypothetical protein
VADALCLCAWSVSPEFEGLIHEPTTPPLPSPVRQRVCTPGSRSQVVLPAADLGQLLAQLMHGVRHLFVFRFGRVQLLGQEQRPFAEGGDVAGCGLQVLEDGTHFLLARQFCAFFVQPVNVLTHLVEDDLLPRVQVQERCTDAR